MNTSTGTGTLPARSSRRLRLHLSQPLFRNAYALITNTALSTGFGLLYWFVAARWFPVTEVGRGQTALNTMMLLSGFGSLRLAGALIRFLPSSGRRASKLIWGSYVIAGCGSVVVAIGYAVVLGDRLGDFLWNGPGAVALLAFAALAWTIFTLQDAAVIGLRRSTWVPTVNGLFSAAKALLLVTIAVIAPRLGIFVSWVVPMVLVAVVVQVLIGRVVTREHRGPPSENPGPRELGSYVAVDYVASLCEVLVVNGIPVVVAVALGAEAVAVFATTWIIGMTLDHVLVHFGSSLTVEAVRSPADLAGQVEQVLRKVTLVLVPLSLLVVVLAPRLLALFGPRYADGGSNLLRLLALAMVPRLVQTLVVIVAKVRQQLRVVLVVSVVQAAAITGTSVWLIDRVGVDGPGWAYLIVSVSSAIVLAPVLWSMLRTDPLPDA